MFPKLNVILICLLSLATAYTQNLIPNSSFEDVVECPWSTSQLDFAEPWKSILVTPDLYHYCSDDELFRPPINFGCTELYPNSGDAFVGLGTFGFFREKFGTWIRGELRLDVDYYCALYVSPVGVCEDGPFNNSCYTDGIGLAIFMQDETNVKVLDATEIIDNVNEWTLVHNCYQMTGEEKRIEIWNHKTNDQTQHTCDSISMATISYMFVDDVILEAFDVMPDTFYLCGEETIQVDYSFYDLPLSWENGLSGGIRVFGRRRCYYPVR